MRNRKRARRRSLIKGLLLGMVAVWLFAALGSSALAQEAEPAVEKAKGPPESLADYWAMSGPTKYALIGSAIWCTALLIEILLRVRVKVFCPPEIVQYITQSLMVQDYVKAWKFCMDNPSPLSRMMAPGIERIAKGDDASQREEAVKEAILDASNIEFDKFKVKNSYLNLNATVNTLLGLFGTISGMIGAFNKMAYAGASGDPSKLAGDIGEALVVTWTGLGIAIIAMYLFYLMTNRLKSVMSSVQQIISSLIEYIKFGEITPGMIIVPAEMRAAYSSGVKGGAPLASAGVPMPPPSKAAAAAPAPEPQAAAEEFSCPSCGKTITMGDKNCPHCQSEIQWE